MALRANPTGTYQEGILVQAPALPGRRRMSLTLRREARLAYAILTPAGPKGTINLIDTWAFGAFKQNPYPELARGLLEYFMQPANYDKIIQSTGGRWVPVYRRLFDSPFWREKPAFKHFIQMAETGVPVSYAGSPTPAAGEVLNTHVIGKMIQRVLVENWEPARALDECHKKIAEVYARYQRA